MSDYNNIKSDDYSEFSPRLNLLLDEAGFKRGHGRLTEFATFFEVQKSSARRWVTQNYPPRDNTLEEIVDEILKRKSHELPKHLTKDDLLPWLKVGRANPFATPLDKNAPSKTTFQRKCRAYIDVYKIAMAQGVDICTLDDDRLEKLYHQIFNDIEIRGLSNPEAEAISKILKSHDFSLSQQ